MDKQLDTVIRNLGHISKQKVINIEKSEFDTLVKYINKYCCKKSSTKFYNIKKIL